ncbi:hypothetical protein AX16_001343 [Volvariella volvacea WC 439]|nr:hypothetical protein AX16_001343 [Volvariella volvacea WC 439]
MPHPQAFASLVSKIQTVSETDEHGQPVYVVAKESTYVRRWAVEPHDIIKEIRILRDLDHYNIIRFLSSSRNTEEMTLTLRTPYFPITLHQLLASPYCSPYLPPLSSAHSLPSAISSSNEQYLQFQLVSKSILHQILCALDYLHDEARGGGVAHRDINPRNIVMSHDGLVKLIDFGVCFRAGELPEDKEQDLFKEYPERMYHEVSTGPYRAPELLFGSRTYNPFAIDMWSLGATMAEFFTPLRLGRANEADDDDDEHSTEHFPGSDDDDDSQTGEGDLDSTGGSNPPPSPSPSSHSHSHSRPPTPLEDKSEHEHPFIVPAHLDPEDSFEGSTGRGTAKWYRLPLFNGARGDLALIASIFRIRGTPTAYTWPGFASLPSSSALALTPSSPLPLARLLPNIVPAREALANLPATSPHFPRTPTPQAVPLDLLTRLLLYNEEERMGAREAKRHPWFWLETGVPLVVPRPGAGSSSSASAGTSASGGTGSVAIPIGGGGGGGTGSSNSSVYGGGTGDGMVTRGEWRETEGLKGDEYRDVCYEFKGLGLAEMIYAILHS